MSYHATTRGLTHIGIPDTDAHITCDWCGVVYRISMGYGPPTWLLDGKAPRGWARGLNADCTRWDCCPRCRNKREVEL